MFTWRRVIAFPDNGGAIAISANGGHTVRRQIQRVPSSYHLIDIRSRARFSLLAARSNREFFLFAPKRIGVAEDCLYLVSYCSGFIRQRSAMLAGMAFMCLAHAVVLVRCVNNMSHKR